VSRQKVATVPADGFFTQTAYRGAFNPTGQVWNYTWTEIGTTGFFATAATGVKNNGPEGIKPAFRNLDITGTGSVHTLSWNQPASGHVTVTLHRLNGQQVALLANGERSAGAQSLTFSTHGLGAGIYLIRLIQPGENRSGVFQVK